MWLLSYRCTYIDAKNTIGIKSQKVHMYVDKLEYGNNKWEAKLKE